MIFQWQEMDLSDQTHGFFLHLNDEIWEGIVCQSEVAMPPRHGYVNIGKRKLETIGWNEILRQPQVGEKKLQNHFESLLFEFASQKCGFAQKFGFDRSSPNMGIQRL